MWPSECAPFIRISSRFNTHTHAIIIGNMGRERRGDERKRKDVSYRSNINSFLQLLFEEHRQLWQAKRFQRCHISSLHSSFHVWFCFQDSMINRRGRAGGRRERQRDRGRQGGGQVYAVRGTRCLCKLALCLFHKGLETQVQIKTWNLPSSIAGIVHWIQWIYVFRSPDHAFKCTVVRLNYSSHAASTAGNSNPFWSQRWICCFWL